MLDTHARVDVGTSVENPGHKRVTHFPRSRIRVLVGRFAAAIAVAVAVTFAAGAGTALKAGETNGVQGNGVVASNDQHTPATQALENVLSRICPVRYDLPADIALDLPSPLGQVVYDRYSWSTFLALAAPAVGARVNRNGDNQTQWDQWSSTVDLIQCNLDSSDCVCPHGNCATSGARYYPPECRKVRDYRKYRVLDQMSKVDDAFLESAQTNNNGTPVGGLSNSPVVDANGNFLRYEILTSPATYNFMVKNKYYDNAVLLGLKKSVTFPCGEVNYRGGNPANERLGALVVKNAWMDLPDGDHAKQRDLYHTEKLLVYTPSYRNLDGRPSCEVRTMGLVGQHFVHKTEKQIRWVWSTFEHKLNAPDCTALPPAGDMGGAGPSKACPASVDKSFNFFPKECSEDGADPAACQTCNTPPASNVPANAPEGTCINPYVTENDVGFCLDQPPAPEAGITKACRQVPLAQYYPTADRLNSACARQIGPKSVWSNYQLISTMYYDLDNDLGCRTIGEFAAKPGETLRVLQRPQVPVGPGQDNSMEAPRKPFLANTSMETDVRSDCMGCHSGATVKDADGNNLVSTDFAYWLQLEVPAGGAIDVVNPHWGTSRFVPPR